MLYASMGNATSSTDKRGFHGCAQLLTERSLATVSMDKSPRTFLVDPRMVIGYWLPQLLIW